MISFLGRKRVRLQVAKLSNDYNGLGQCLNLGGTGGFDEIAENAGLGKGVNEDGE